MTGIKALFGTHIRLTPPTRLGRGGSGTHRVPEMNLHRQAGPRRRLEVPA